MIADSSQLNGRPALVTLSPRTFDVSCLMSYVIASTCIHFKLISMIPQTPVTEMHDTAYAEVSHSTDGPVPLPSAEIPVQYATVSTHQQVCVHCVHYD